MACPSVVTGSAFLSSTLAHIDCQAQTIGSYGWAALADPSSPTAVALGGLLTIFIAIFAFRLLLGYPLVGRDVVTDILRIGIVLTLATSWPAWRVVGYDLLIDGPQQLSRAIGQGSGLPGGAGDLSIRLQNVDNGLAALNVTGSGRVGVAQGDWFQLGFARSAYLINTLGSLALVRLSSGLLLAVAPLLAGLLLFVIGRPIFEGWVRGLVFAFLASIIVNIVLGAELALLEPWLLDVLRKRAADQPVLDAPIEILAVVLSFALVVLGSLAVAARVAFHGSTSPTPSSAKTLSSRGSVRASMDEHTKGVSTDVEPARAVVIAQAVSESIRRQERITQFQSARESQETKVERSTSVGAQPSRQAEALGSSWRRASRRVSAAGTRRDRAS